jgi:DNA-binding IclR family transcriptional regulator
MKALMSSKITGLIDPKTLRIIRLFLNNPEELYHLQKISKQAQVPLGSTFRLTRKIAQQGLVQTIEVGKLKLYKLDKKEKKELEILR